MSLTLILALQAAAPPASALAPIDFDLARLPRLAIGIGGLRCDRADPTAIVVCARRGGGAYPLDEMARMFEPGRIVAETRLFGNVIGDAHVEAVPMDRGAVSNRAMLRLRLPF
ncbi:MAG: hypothetical protein QOH47_2198 [Sphingomonadales bacterium]|jgi:hypothetical protein|nr:hypothetical protein [Sphingomonadales bacterium]